MESLDAESFRGESIQDVVEIANSEIGQSAELQYRIRGDPSGMSLLSTPFDPAREAALVTGAGNGIGRAIAQALVGEGVRTVFADISEETGRGGGQSFAAAGTGGGLGRRSRQGARRANAAGARASRRRAGDAFRALAPRRRGARPITPWPSPRDLGSRCTRSTSTPAFTSRANWRERLIAAKEPGSFLLLTSLHAGTPRNLPHYSTAKAGMAMLVKELAKTFGRYGIRVNALVPGAIAAGGFVADPSLAKHIPLGRLGQAEDLAPMALAVLSNRVSAYVTGAAIVVDGGLSLTNWFEPPELGEI